MYAVICSSNSIINQIYVRIHADRERARERERERERESERASKRERDREREREIERERYREKKESGEGACVKEGENTRSFPHSRSRCAHSCVRMRTCEIGVRDRPQSRTCEIDPDVCDRRGRRRK